MDSSAIIHFIYPIAIIAFILYRRIKRSIGFQPFKKSRLITRTVIFSIIMVIILFTSAIHPISYLYDLVGIILGLILITYAIKHSNFEMRGTALFYRTHIWIESLVLFIFLSRFAFRIVYVIQMSNQSMNNPQNMQAYAKDPLTLGVFFLLATYYIGFYIFVIKKGSTILAKNIVDDK